MFFLCLAPFVLLIHLSKDVLCGTLVTTIGGGCYQGDTCTTTPATVCDTITNTCLLDVGETCAGSNAENCKTGTSCDRDSTCKLNPGGDCSTTSGNSDNCKSGTTCDGSACKINVGQTCDGFTSHCSFGSSCDTGNVCKLNPGGDCSTTSGNSDNCKSGTTCDGSACKINVGQTCDGFTSDCSFGSSCDTGNVCKLNPGGDCSITSGNADNCKSGTTCDGSACSGAMGLVASTFLLFGSFLVKAYF